MVVKVVVWGRVGVVEWSMDAIFVCGWDGEGGGGR